MTSEDQKMLQSALWHISNSVTNGKSQTTECEITKWLKEKFNPLPHEQSSEDLKKAADCCLESVQPVGFMEGDYDGTQVHDAFVAGAKWQKERTIDKACEWLRYCVDVDDEVKIIDGEPEVKSFIQKNLHRIEVTNQIVEDFKKAMEDEQ